MAKIYLLLLLIIASNASAQDTRTFFHSQNKTVAGGTGISFGSTNNCISWTITSPATCSYTVPGGTHVGLIVIWGGTAAVASAVTYNGSASSSGIHCKADGAGSTKACLAIFINPPTGASDTLSITFASGALVASVIPVYGINQTGTVGNSWRAFQDANDGGTPVASSSLSVSNAVSGDAVLDCVVNSQATVLTQGGSQTSVMIQNNPAGDGWSIGSSSVNPASGSTSMTWTWTGGNAFWGQTGVALIPG